MPNSSYFNTLNKSQQDALTQAVRDAIRMKDLIMLRNALVVGADPHPALFEGIREKNIDMVKMAIAAGADVNACSTGMAEWNREGPYAAIHWSIEYFDKDISDYLLKKGANVDTRWGTGDTPLLWAICNDHYARAAYYLEHGANPLLEDKAEPPVCAFAKLQEKFRDAPDNQQLEGLYKTMIAKIALVASNKLTSAHLDMSVKRDTCIAAPQLKVRKAGRRGQQV